MEQEINAFEKSNFFQKMSESMQLFSAEMTIQPSNDLCMKNSTFLLEYGRLVASRKNILATQVSNIDKFILELSCLLPFDFRVDVTSCQSRALVPRVIFRNKFWSCKHEFPIMSNPNGIKNYVGFLVPFETQTWYKVEKGVASRHQQVCDKYNVKLLCMPNGHVKVKGLSWDDNVYAVDWIEKTVIEFNNGSKIK